MFYIKHTCPHLSSFLAFLWAHSTLLLPTATILCDRAAQFPAPVWQAPACSRVCFEHASQQRGQAAFIRAKQRWETEGSLTDYNLINHPANGHSFINELVVWSLLCPTKAQRLCLVSGLVFLSSPVHESGLL